MTCTEDKKCTYTHQITKFKDDTISANITSTEGEVTYLVSRETKTITRALVVENPFFLAEGAVAQLSCKMTAEYVPKPDLEWTVPPELENMVQKLDLVFDRDDKVWLAVLNVTVTSTTTADEINKLSCSSVTYNGLDA